MALRAEHALPTTDLTPLSAEQEHQLLSFRLEQVLSICAVFKPAALPKKVASAASTFLQRFFLSRSVMQHDLQLITVVCIYIAAKARASGGLGDPHCPHSITHAHKPSAA